MCLGIPLKVVAVDGQVARCSGRLGIVPIDVTLVAPVVVGDWLLTFLGAARARLDAAEAARIDRALDGLEAIERGQPYDAATFFPDLVDREPELPEHLRGLA